MTEETANEIKGHYQAGRGSIQDLARIYHVSVEEILNLIGEGTATTVAVQGDMIDQSEAGAGADMNYGKEFRTPFSLD